MPTAATDPHIVFIVCHQTKYLDIVLAGLSRQTRRPERVIVSCDVDERAIGEVIEQWAPTVGAPVSWVRRAHHGIARCSQVRNNAARHAIFDLGIRRGRLIQLDGDILATPTLVEEHARLGEKAELVYANRVDLDRAASESLDAHRVALPETPSLTEAMIAELERRHRRAQRHLVLRRMGLAPKHKPKLLGANWSASIDIWLRLNGFDEHYQGWGYLDDEFARRAARAGASCAIGIRDAVAFHLWHEKRQPPGPMTANPNYQRFARRDLPVRAEHGLEHPIPQNPVSATVFEGKGQRLRAAPAPVGAG